MQGKRMCVSSAPERDGERGGEGAEREREFQE